MKQKLCILFLLLAAYAHGQSDEEYWDKWNTNYPEVDIISILAFEKFYADSVEKNLDIPQYYLRLDKYRFKAEYLGKKRATNKEVVASMKRVFKMFVGNPSQLDGMIEKEVLFRVGQEDIWMSIQPQILKALKKEVKKGATVTLFCLFLNEHSANVLYNTFLISEFDQ
ncbi:MAG: hypothetical protein FWH36_06170 [Lentimicrobiaceae bacterium]|nr:hypothetical protein [Lentimicrobiaceae bacterium]